MHKWLSRLMTVVFLFNVLSPAYAQSVSSQKKGAWSIEHSGAQQKEDVWRIGHSDAPRNNNTWRIEPVASELSLERRLADSFKQAMEKMPLSRKYALEQFRNAGTFKEMEAAYKKLDELREKDSSSGGKPEEACPTYEAFLYSLENNAFAHLEEVIEYIDPISGNCKDHLAAAFAAKYLYLILQDVSGANAALGEDDAERIAFLSRLRYRAAASLKRLSGWTASTGNVYEARGSLRILLAMIDRFVSENNLQLMEKKFYVVGPSKETWQQENQRLANSAKSAFNPFWNDELQDDLMDELQYKNYFQKNSILAEELSAQQLSDLVGGKLTTKEFNHKNYQDLALYNPLFLKEGFNSAKNELSKSSFVKLSNEMYNEIADLKKEIPSFTAEKIKNWVPLASLAISKQFGTASSEFSFLQIDVEYAALYAAITGDVDLLKKLVALFEKKGGEEAKANYTGALEVLFDGVAQSLRSETIGEKNAEAMIWFLIECADPSHAVDTRILALSTLSLVTEQPDPLSKPTAASFANGPTRRIRTVTDSGESVYKHLITYKDRFRLAQYVADLYAPLQNTSRYGIKDYGLSAEEMTNLSNQLASVYMGFLPLKAPTVTLGRCGRVEKMDMENQRIITARDLLLTKEDQLREADCPVRYSNGGVFVFTSTGTVEMSLDNFRNSRKSEEEITNFTMRLVGEAAMWVIGVHLAGKLLQGARLLPGVIKSVPRAVRSGKIVYKSSKGTRIYRLTASAKRAKASMKVGTKYMSGANFNNLLAKNGLQLEQIGATGKKASSKAVALRTIPRPATRLKLTGGDVVSGMAGEISFNVGEMVSLPYWSALDRAGMWRRFQALGRVEKIERGVWNGLKWTPKEYNNPFYPVLKGRPWTPADRALFQQSNWLTPFFKMERMPVNEVTTIVDNGRFINGFIKDVPVVKVPAIGSVVAENPWVKMAMKSYGGTLKFFGWWQVGDIGFKAMLGRPLYDPWVEKQAEQSVKDEMAKYDSLSPESLAELETQDTGAPEPRHPSRALAGLEGSPEESFGWINLITLPSFVWDKMFPSPLFPSTGYNFMLIPSIQASQIGLSKIGIGSNPLLPAAYKQRLAFSAHNAAFHRAQIKMVNNRYAKAVEQRINSLDTTRTKLKQDIVTLKAQYPNVNWKEEEESFLNLLDEYEESLREAEKTVNLAERSKQMDAASKRYTARTELLNKKINDKSFEAYLHENIDALEVDRERNLITLREEGFDKTHPELCDRLMANYDDIINKLKGMRGGTSSAEIKLEQVERYTKSFKQILILLLQEVELLRLEQEAENSVLAEDKSELYPSESADVSSLAY